MKKRQLDFINKLFDQSKKCLVILSITMGGVLFVLISFQCLFKAGILSAEWFTAISTYGKKTELVLLALFFMVVFALFISALFHTKTKDELREEVKSPLINVTKQQEKGIIKVLNKLLETCNPTRKRSTAAKFLASLKYLDLLDNTDTHRLLLWVEKEAEFREEDSAQFKKTYERRELDKQGAPEYVAMIEEILKK